jgi:hypothetical protein
MITLVTAFRGGDEKVSDTEELAVLEQDKLYHFAPIQIFDFTYSFVWVGKLVSRNREGDGRISGPKMGKLWGLDNIA